MTRARKELVSVETTPYYHCICRCVRRAFLCGEDSYSGKNYEHRRGWVLERLRELQGVFAVDVCAYAAMSGKKRTPMICCGRHVKTFEWPDYPCPKCGLEKQ
nr:hypothetical protein [Thioalkalivibrio sp. ALE28]